MLAAIARVCDSQGFILGPEVEALECEIAALTGAAGAVGCASGTEALWLALVAAGVKPGDSVITTAFSFFASASAIVRAGATPVFVDVDPGTLNLDAALAALDRKRPRHRAPPKTCARSFPFIFTDSAPTWTRFDAIASEFDRSHRRRRRPSDWRRVARARRGIVGRNRCLQFLSHQESERLRRRGDGHYEKPGMAEHMRRLRNHGSPRRYYHHEFGWNGRMDAIQAAVLRVKLAYIADWNRAARHAATYDRLFGESGLTSGISNQLRAPMRLLARSPQATHVFHQYVIRAERRDELRKFLAERKIGSEIYYPLPLHLQPVFSYLGLKAGDLPVAEQAAQEVLALPMFPELTEAEIRCVVESIADFYS